MQDCYGQYGWKEFHRNRKNILDEFDKILEQTSNRPIQTAHGSGVEAYIRKWLSEFLPKKYGVTSGYIVPNLYEDAGKIYHFDIIIYNCLDAPVLWTEGNEDNSEQGKYRAIPAQHVVAVYEVKSRLSKKNISEALSKLDQTQDFKEQLNEKYSCGLIFIDLKESVNRSASIIKELYNGKNVFGFRGGIVFRYEGDDTITGLIFISILDRSESNKNIHRYSPIAKRIDDLNIYQSEDGNLQVVEQGAGVILVKTAENNWSVSKLYGVSYEKDGISTHLMWSRSNFSRFCVDLLGSLEGLPYNDKNRPSFGMIFDSIRLERAPLQSSEPNPGYPFLTIFLHGGGSNGEKLLINYEEDLATIEYWVEVVNEGYADATISDDMFKTCLVLPRNKKALKSTKFAVEPRGKNRSFEDILNSEGLEIPYRLVYKVGQDGKELFAVERTIKILGSNIDFL
jgi:hypothetical protein